MKFLKKWIYKNFLNDIHTKLDSILVKENDNKYIKKVDDKLIVRKEDSLNTHIRRYANLYSETNLKYDDIGFIFRKIDYLIYRFNRYKETYDLSFTSLSQFKLELDLLLISLKKYNPKNQIGFDGLLVEVDKKILNFSNSSEPVIQFNQLRNGIVEMQITELNIVENFSMKTTNLEIVIRTIMNKDIK